MMTAEGPVVRLGRLDGVREATLCGNDGKVLESSSAQPTLHATATRLVTALDGFQVTLPALDGDLTLTLEGGEGVLLCARTGNGVLLVSTTPEANQGVIRLEMRGALRTLGS